MDDSYPLPNDMIILDAILTASVVIDILSASSRSCDFAKCGVAAFAVCMSIFSTFYEWIYYSTIETCVAAFSASGFTTNDLQGRC